MSLPPDRGLESPAQDRRGYPRYFPAEMVQVLFAHRDAEVPTAGHIGDVSRSGVRIVAPPMARPFLHWPDACEIHVLWSDSARTSGMEGMKLRAHVVRIQVDAHAYVLHAAFDGTGRDGDWDALMAWISQLGQ